MYMSSTTESHLVQMVLSEQSVPMHYAYSHPDYPTAMYIPTQWDPDMCSTHGEHF